MCDKLRQANDLPPPVCPHSGYINKLAEYQSKFGVWLMPDCKTDSQKMEHLAESLIHENDCLWPLARQCAASAASHADAINKSAPGSCERFRDVDLIKAEVHTWMAWQRVPGSTLGAAVNSKILGCDSPQALGLLEWLKSLYGF